MFPTLFYVLGAALFAWYVVATIMVQIAIRRDLQRFRTDQAGTCATSAYYD